MNESLRNKVALITGTSRLAGIGTAIARELGAAGASLLLAFYRPYDRLMPWGVGADEPESLVAELRRAGTAVEAVEIDLADPGAARHLVEHAYASFGALHILVNNAACSEAGSVDTLDAAQLDRHYAVNLRATALLCSELARRHPAGQPGRIITITSGQGLDPMPEELAYAATKGALGALTLRLSAALAPRGITVNAVDPGPTDTGWMSDDLKRSLEQSAPMGRVGQPLDAARLVRFLASDDAGWITGQIIRSRGAL